MSTLSAQEMLTALRGRDDTHLDAGCRQQRRHESGSTVEVIAHLAEIYRRRLHLSLGYKSLAEYCQRSLGYSEGETWVRIAVGRASPRYQRFSML